MTRTLAVLGHRGSHGVGAAAVPPPAEPAHDRRGAAHRLREMAVPLARYLVARARGHKLPFAVAMSLTDRCNFRCVYCHVPEWADREMPTDAWLRVVDDLRAAGMIRASLLGGEPLLRKDIGAIVSHLRRHGVHTAMNTNGWLVEQRIDEIVDLDVLSISLDGPPEVHDAQRHPGSFERCLRGIEAARRRDVRVVTMTVLTARSAPHVEFVLELAREHGLTAYFNLEHDADGDVDAAIAKGLADAEIVALSRRLLALKEQGWPVGPSRTYLEAVARRGRRLRSCDTCLASRYFCHVLPDGRVVPCLLTHAQPSPLEVRPSGAVAAFAALDQPRGKGCSCEPLQELDMLLRLTPEAVRNGLHLL